MHKIKPIKSPNFTSINPKETKQQPIIFPMIDIFDKILSIIINIS